MCGPYIHGRSWWNENIKDWEHFCEPYKVNAHCEMPTPGILERHGLRYEDAMMLWNKAEDYRRKGGESHVRLCVMNDPIARRLPVNGDLPSVDSDCKEIVSRLIEIVGLDCEDNMRDREGRYHIQVRKRPNCIRKWGLQPWDGEFKLQHGDVIPPYDLDFVPKIQDKNFLPQTRNDLIQWTKNHWDKRDDGDEFLDAMPECLDLERLFPKLPDSIKKDKSVPRYDSVNHAIRSLAFNEKVIQPVNAADFEMDSRGKEYLLVKKTLEATADACDRWVDMFKEAPNEFWAARN